jgi:hypothetical protein
MKLVENPREVLFSYWSIKAKALGIGIPVAWAVLPEAWQKAYFPDWIPQSMAYVTIVFLGVSFVCQFLDQTKPSDVPKP